jgi:beta-lactamase superfamily II metal-dependent hydrolase
MGVEFHFLNVGYGDCTIVHWPERVRGDKTLDERIMMVDIYHHEDHEEYEDAIKYYKTHFKKQDGSIKPIFRFVCSHPHQDHICGLKKLFDDNGIKILNFWDLEHSFEPDDFNGHPTHEEDWEAYESLGGKESPATVLRYTRETKPQPLWTEDGDRITILSPSASLVKYAHYKEDGTKRDMVEIDEMSFALSIRINDRSVILAGDGRATPTWNDIYENCKEILKKCYVLKAGHHGHETSFHEDAVKLMAPVLIVLSNSKEENDSNGAEDKYKKACPKALICKTWEGSVFVKVPFDADKLIEVNREV